MPLWGKAWNELNDDEKLGYKEKAKVACPVNNKEGLIKQIASLMTELSNEHEIDLVCLGHDRNCQKQYLFGEGNPLAFISNAKDFLSNLYTMRWRYIYFITINFCYTRCLRS
ncbi:hypothetical protein SNE40_007164 [Patella caerulea]|uniref:Uncharacterized protein n=1 Tax=Patella caerulea TaxID=87958 RepID=A0AAN8JXY9_PATCE